MWRPADGTNRRICAVSSTTVGAVLLFAVGSFFLGMATAGAGPWPMTGRWRDGRGNARRWVLQDSEYYCRAGGDSAAYYHFDSNPDPFGQYFGQAYYDYVQYYDVDGESNELHADDVDGENNELHADDADGENSDFSDGKYYESEP